VSLNGAHLQGASLDGAHLQGASFLNSAELQGASLVRAELQGASLDGAQLQGASLIGAQLQGVSLNGAHLQGVSLNGAHLQGASLDGAQLQGASLIGAQLQGASLVDADLQGASFEEAALHATDLSHAYLWRTNSTPPPSVSAIRMSGESWLPQWIDENEKRQPWDDKAYQALRTLIESVPPGARDLALENVRSLDCGNPNKTLASCDPSVPPPPEAVAWQKTLEDRVDAEAYTNALAAELKALVCSDDDDAIYVVRSDGFQNRLRAAGAAASDLIDDLMNKVSKDCSVYASLTDADKARLLQIKRDAIKKAGQ
jgi:Pentapeptide repeats (8 copies)